MNFPFALRRSCDALRMTESKPQQELIGGVDNVDGDVVVERSRRHRVTLGLWRSPIIGPYRQPSGNPHDGARGPGSDALHQSIGSGHGHVEK